MNLYLIGYRGAGKSEVARFLASTLNRECVEVDARIQRHENMTIADIFAKHGEPHFRALESKFIREIARQQNLIVDLGGGAIIQEANRELILASGKCIWLKASANVLWDRIQGDSTTKGSRPALTQLSGLDEVRQVLADREPIYAECAEFEIETDEMSPVEVADQIAAWVAKVDKP